MQPSVLLAPAAGDALFRGFDRLAELLAYTLGPSQGHALSESLTSRANRPEFVSDAAVLARRMMQFPDRAEDVGAMLLRQLVWRVHLRAGDGSATAAVVAQTLLREGRRLVAGGANPMRLRAGAEAGLQAALASIATQARPVRDYGDLIRLALTATGEEPLSIALGEMFHNLGNGAHIDIEEFAAPYIERDYHEGGRWQARISSPHLYTDAAAHRATLTHCAVALFAGDVTGFEQVEPLLRFALELAPEGADTPVRVALFAHEVRGEALGALIANTQQKKIQAVAVDLRRAGAQREADFDDLATLTGATVIAPHAGGRLEALGRGDIGMATRIFAGTEDVIVAAEGRQAAREKVIRSLTGRARNRALPDAERDDARFRIARLIGQLGTLKIGAHTEAERTSLRQKADKGLRILPLALEEGWLPGGGVGLVQAAQAATACAGELAETDPERAWGSRALATALEAPFRRILSNARIDPAPKLAEVRARNAKRGAKDFGVNALRGEIVRMPEAGLLDAAGVMREAVTAAVSGAMMALSTDATVLRSNPPLVYEP
jgi:chaperonin GroEL